MLILALKNSTRPSKNIAYLFEGSLEKFPRTKVGTEKKKKQL